jgi:acetylornithine deacetylase
MPSRLRGLHVDEVASLLASLIAIDSVNPSLEASGGGERHLAAFLAERLAAAGLATELVEVAPGRPNLIARLTGSRPGPTLMLNAHLDTVGVHGMVAPFAPREANGRMYGRGSADTKAGLAAMVVAAERLAASRHFSGTLVLCGVADEEYLSAGTEHSLRSVSADACVVAEDTALDLITAHQGFGWYEVETVGRAAHGMHPDVGIDAIAHMGLVLADLARYDCEVLAHDVHPLAGRAVFHNSTIHGGSELGIYPERCVLGIEIGCNPGMRMAARRAELEALLQARRADDPGFSGCIRIVVEREPFEVESSARIVAVMEAAGAAYGRRPVRRGANAWMDAALIQAAGIPTVVFGPGGAGHHSSEESVELSQVTAAAEILEAAARNFLA